MTTEMRHWLPKTREYTQCVPPAMRQRLIRCYLGNVRHRVTGEPHKFVAEREVGSVLYTPHLCLDCGTLVWRAHPGPNVQKTLTLGQEISNALWVNKAYTRRRAEVDHRGVKIKREARVSSMRVLNLLRALRYGDPIEGLPPQRRLA